MTCAAGSAAATRATAAGRRSRAIIAAAAAFVPAGRHQAFDFLAFTVRAGDVLVAAEDQIFKLVFALGAGKFINRHLLAPQSLSYLSNPSITAAASKGNMISWCPTRE